MSTERLPVVDLHSPAWLDAIQQHYLGRAIPDSADRMALAISIARANITHQSGGPFGAAVFELPSYKVLSVGANLVLAGHCCVLHAEIVAIMRAQTRLQLRRFDLHGLQTELVTSAEPCAMCLGALQWSGVRHVLYGAPDADIRAVGFDEGLKPERWAERLAQQNLDIRQGPLREEAVQVLRDYVLSNGTIY